MLLCSTLSSLAFYILHNTVYVFTFFILSRTLYILPVTFLPLIVHLLLLSIILMYFQICLWHRWSHGWTNAKERKFAVCCCLLSWLLVVACFCVLSCVVCGRHCCMLCVCRFAEVVGCLLWCISDRFLYVCCLFAFYCWYNLFTRAFTWLLFYVHLSWTI